MFGERCSLCGGKLDSRKICKECGLNNSKSEKYYKINTSPCDGQPLTHVHEEPEEYRSDQKAAAKPETYQKEAAKPETYQKEAAKPKTCQKEAARPKTYQKEAARPETYREAVPGSETYRKPDPAAGGYRLKEKKTTQGSGASKTSRQKKAGWASKLVAACVILSAAGTIIGTLAEMDFDIPFISEEEYEPSDPYQMLEESGEELPEEGEYAEFELTSGKYIVGVHIPAGNYSAAMLSDYDAIRVTDEEHFIYLYEYPAKEGIDYRDDLRLFDGALVEITAEETVVLITENGQQAHSEENPLTETYEFKGTEEKVAGVDFEPGVYDIYAAEGYGNIWINLEEDSDEEDSDEEDFDEEDYEEDYYDEEYYDEEYYDGENFYIGNGTSNGTVYKNVVLPKGAKLLIEGDSYEGDNDFRVILKPSPQIATTDYMQTYMEYY